MSKIDLALPIQKDGLSQHYAEVLSFQTQRAKAAQRNVKVMSAVAGISILANFGLVWSLAALMPLQKIVPVYLWVRPDGTVDNSVAMSRLPATQSDAVVSAALWEYVRLREGYSYDTAQYGYDAVSRMSSDRARDVYQGWFNYPNPVSPQVVVGQKGQIDIEHISTARLSPAVVQVRYRHIVTMTGQRPVTTTWTATLQYSLVTALPATARLNNPGGVLVTSYQAEEDSQ